MKTEQIALAASVAAIVMCSAACKKDSDTGIAAVEEKETKVEVSSISLDKNVLDMLPDDTYKLTATIAPEDATDKTITWKSEDESIATVDQEGLVTAVGKGEVIISATAGTCRDECMVSVEDLSFGFNKTEGIIGLGDKLSLRPYISSAFDLDWSKLTITSDNPETAEVTEDFAIVGKAQGEATVTASYTYSERVLKSEFRIEIEDSFLTFVDDVFSISTRGVVAESTIYAGSVSVGDKVSVVRATKDSDDLELTVSDMDINRKNVTTAYKGENVAFLFNESPSITTADLPRGSVIMNPQTKRLQRANKIYGTVVITGKEFVAKGYNVRLSFNGIELDAKIADLGKYGTLRKGETCYNICFEITGGDRMPCFLGGEIKIMVDKEIGTLIVSDLKI